MAINRRIEPLLDAFPLGRIVLVMVVLAALSGPILLLGGKRGEVTLDLWTFAEIHTRCYNKIVRRFNEQYPNVKIKIELVQFRALHRRLNAAFHTDLGAPDIVEIEISEVGRFFAGPLEQVGFVDLTDWLHERGLYEQLVEARYRPWSSRGRIFGIPRDVHPSILAYNKPEFDKYGIDPTRIDTWDDYIQAVKPMTDTDGDGQLDRFALELRDDNADDFRKLLFQRGYDYFDDRGNLLLDSEQVADTLAYYLRMIRGPDRIGGQYPWGGVLTQAMLDNKILSFILPDWRIGMIKKDAPLMAGRLRLCMLPRWKDSPGRVATRGGTMVSVCKSSKNVAMALKFLEFFYTHPTELLMVYEETGIIPPVKKLWNHPVLQAADPFFGGQRIGQIYVEAAPHTPPIYRTPFSNIADRKLNQALVRAAERCKVEGVENARGIAREELAQSAREVRRQIARNPFY